MKLTKLEQIALEHMSKSLVGEKFMPKTILSLVRKGLAEREFSIIGWKARYRITDAGRAALRDGGRG